MMFSCKEKVRREKNIIKSMRRERETYKKYSRFILLFGI
jgi:hypothetical protein